MMRRGRIENTAGKGGAPGMWVGVAELEVERCWDPLDRWGNNCIESDTWVVMYRLFIDKNGVMWVVFER